MDARESRVLMLATDGFAELLETRQLLRDAGVHVSLAAPGRAAIEGVTFADPVAMAGASTCSVQPDLPLAEVDVGAFDALVLPGGVRSPDTLRTLDEAVALVRAFAAAGKTVAAICHAPWMMVEAGIVQGRRATGWRSIRTDLANAGALVVDQAVVVDGNLITSRMPGDITAFAQAVIAALARTDEP